MKKIIMFSLLILSCGFLTNTASTGKASPGLNFGSPPSQSFGARDFKTERSNKMEIMAKAASLAVPFVQNAGQFNVEVKYAADLFSGRFFLTGRELVYSLLTPSHQKDARPERPARDMESKENLPGRGLAFREFFVDKKGGKIGFAPTGEGKAETKISYFRGSDASKWRSGVASYQGVSLGQVYPGVEVKLKASGKNVEKIFYVSPRSNVSEIKIGVAGVDGLKIAEDGRLLFKNTLGELAMRAPDAWQEIDGRRHEVKVGYRLLGKQLYGFKVIGEYNKDYPLIIDPDLDTLMASTYLGGNNTDNANSIALDNSGNVYLAGSTFSMDFPTTVGAYDRSYNNSNNTLNNYHSDVFVAKMDANLSMQLACTFLGGGLNDIARSLAVDSSGNVYLTGDAGSGDFPTTEGAYNREFHSIFVCKLDNSLTTLLASTFLGGGMKDTSNSLALDSLGNVYLTGMTKSADFPTTQGAYDQTYNTSGHYNDYNGDVFVSKLNGNLTLLLASTFLGGDQDEGGNSLALDSSGNVYLTGYTDSNNFPVTSGAYDQSFNYGTNVFVSKLDGNLNTLLASTYLGGGDSEGHSLGLDSAGNVFVTGFTVSDYFPTTEGAYDRSFDDSQMRSGDYENYFPDVFVSKLDGALTTLLASTFLGGWDVEYCTSLVLDSSGNIYLTGTTESSNFPVTPGAYDRTSIYGDAFVSKLNNSLTALLSSTFLGGRFGGYGNSLALDCSGNIFMTGETGYEFPTTAGAYDRSYNGFNDAFVSKMNGSPGSVKLNLLAERLEVKAFSMVRQYGQIQFTVETSGMAAAQYRLMRRQSVDEFVLLRVVTPQELQNNQCLVQDKYLQRDAPYTYMVEAYNCAGQLVGRSAEKTI